MTDHDCQDCQQGSLDENDALALAFDALDDAQKEALAGRATEASVLNQTAQLAIQLADRLRVPLINPIATGIIQ